MPPETPNNQNIPPGFIPPKETDDMKTPVAKPAVEVKVMPSTAEEATKVAESVFPKASALPPEIKKPVPAPVPPPPPVTMPKEVAPPPRTAPGTDAYREVPELGTEGVVPPPPPAGMPPEIAKPTPAPATPPPPPPAPKPLPQTPLQKAVGAKPIDPLQKKAAIRTLQGDIAQTVHSQNISVADIALAEQKRAHTSPEAPIEKDSSGKWWVMGTGLFILLGIAVIAGIFYFFPPQEDVPIVEGPQDTLLYADDRTVLDIAGMTFESFAKRVTDTLLVQGGPGTIRGVSLVRVLGEGSNVKHITTEEFFTLLKSRAPARLSRSLLDGFVFGVATPTSKPSAFLLFKTNSYETAFAGMLEWEDLIADDVPFITYTMGPPEPPIATTTATTTASTTKDATTTKPFEIDPLEIDPFESGASTTPATGTPATTAGPAFVPPPSRFVDMVVKNKDTRALVYPDGTIRLLYAFPDKETLVIAQNKEVLSLLIDRLSTARFTR